MMKILHGEKPMFCPAIVKKDFFFFFLELLVGRHWNLSGDEADMYVHKS